MPRFAVLLHDGPRGPHWDLFLETGASLATWALAREPDTLGPIDAERLADHRLAYLEHEGPVSGDRGFVTRWDAGTYRLIGQSDRETALVFEGNRLNGHATLTCVSDDMRQWRFAMTPDRARPG
ncbi:MAG TPA: hypothetical protein DD670_08660 [Planctomycetaceae bacterium]|nr:hypothetical protein [Planctomycetaceae bacterium]